MMDDDGECIHGLGLKAACVICNGRAKREENMVHEGEALFSMVCQYPFTCVECGGRYKAGSLLTVVAGSGNTCEECVE